MENPSIVFNLRYFSANDNSSANQFYRCRTHRNIISYLAREFAQNNLSDTDKQIVQNFVEISNKDEKDILDYTKHRKGSQGLCTLDGQELADKKSRDDLRLKLAKTESTVWSSVISFSQDFGDKFLTSTKEGQELVSAHLATLLNGSQLDPNNIEGFVAVHTNTAHHHIHLVFWEKEPRNINSQGKASFASKKTLPKESITLFKSAILKDVKENKADYFSLRDTVRDGAVNALLNDKRLFEHFILNSKDIIEGGHFQFARLNKEQQARVNKLVRMALALNPEVNAQYKEYKSKLQASQADYISLIKENGDKIIPKNIANFYSSRLNELHLRIGNKFLKMLKDYKYETEYYNRHIKLNKKRKIAYSKNAGRNNASAYSSAVKQAGRNAGIVGSQLLKVFLAEATEDIKTHQKSMEQFKYEKYMKGESIIYEND